MNHYYYYYHDYYFAKKLLREDSSLLGYNVVFGQVVTDVSKIRVLSSSSGSTRPIIIAT